MSRLAFFKTEIAVRNAQPDEVAPMIESSGVAGLTRASMHRQSTSSQSHTLQRQRSSSEQQHQRKESDTQSIGGGGARPSPLYLLQTNQIEHDALLITLQQPVVYVRPSALDHALVIWLNYKHSYDFWVEEMSAQKSELMAQMVHSQRVQPVSSRPVANRARSTMSPSPGPFSGRAAISSSPSPVASSGLTLLIPSPPTITTSDVTAASVSGSAGTAPAPSPGGSSITPLTLKQAPSVASAYSGSTHSGLPTPTPQQPPPQPGPAYPSILFLELTVVNMGVCLALDTPSHFSEVRIPVHE